MKNYYKFISITLLGLLIYSCNPGEEAPEDDSNSTIWKGATKTFTKANGADPNLPNNQDRITSNIWITRGNGGSIYNIFSETTENANSPAGTMWSIGTVDDINNLTFQDFRSAVNKPREVVGKNLVLHLLEDNIYISVKFTSWSSGNGSGSGGGGGFSYERSTP